jgi:hypothetical protein
VIRPRPTDSASPSSAVSGRPSRWGSVPRPRALLASGAEDRGPAAGAGVVAHPHVRGQGYGLRAVAAAAYFAPTKGRRVKVSALLRARESGACREFRGWLRGLQRIDEDEVNAQLGGLHNAISSLLQSGPGKVIRFLATTSASVLLNEPTGTVAGVLDSFVVDRLLRAPGPAAFISRTYPSIFERGRPVDDSTG